LNKYINISMCIFLSLALITIIYALGSTIVNDYINNGLSSVVLSFIIGIPIMLAFGYVAARFYKK